jgi:predicted 2-oxoglutarate/Fe(II)-dependent dioxygenase YbiX
MTSPTPRAEPIPGRNDLFLVRDFLSPDECADFIRRSEERGYEEAAISAGKQQVIVKEVRNNDRILWDDPLLAADWWARCRPFVPPSFGRWQACGVNERFRFYRYHSGQKFSKHRDGSFERTSDETSWITLMVYLNHGYEGGRTSFFLAGESAPRVVEPATGTALFFMHDRLHEGEEVIAGCKYVLRTDVMYRRERG